MSSILEWLFGAKSPEQPENIKCRQGDADHTLRKTIEDGTYNVIECGITAIAIVDRDPNGEPIIVPIARFSLREDIENADMDILIDLVKQAIDAVRTSFHDISIRHYDIQFTFSGDDLFKADECRRIVLKNQLVKQYGTKTRLTMSDIRDLVQISNKGDEITPDTWENCKDYCWTDNAAIMISDTVASEGVNTKEAICTNATHNDDLCRRWQLYW